MVSGSTSSRQLIAANEDEFGLHYLGLKFPGRRKRRSSEAKRQELLALLDSSLRWAADGSKPYLGELSPGCRRCVEGSWSCLFINNRCNASCFYCPAPQEKTDQPATNNLSFRHPDGYATYLQRLGFKGASISGGEPLLTPHRTLAFLRAARAALGPQGHLWLYTNGILLTREFAAQLAGAGLDEIRFDIGATGYRLDRIALAAGLIPTLTVEIPAVPEECSRLKRLLPELVAHGVDHLNLHQLRLTRHNFAGLTERNYTYLHGEKVTVLESELTALEILRSVHAQRLGLGVNYCSFVFKHRHQRAAARFRAAQLDAKPWETVTPAGYVRRLELAGDADRLATLVTTWRQAGHPASGWHQDPVTGQLAIAPERLSFVRWRGVRLQISYDQVQLADAGRRSRGGWALPLGPDGAATICRHRASPTFVLGGSGAERFRASWLDGMTAGSLSREQRPFREWERIPAGLQNYF